MTDLGEPDKLLEWLGIESGWGTDYSRAAC